MVIPQRGENVGPHKRVSRVNPNRGKQGGIPEKKSLGIANPKGYPSWCQTELIPRCQRENSNEDPSWCQKELIPRCQRKKRGKPEKESPGIFITKGYQSWRQKEINSKVPTRQFLHSVQIVCTTDLKPKGKNSEVPAGDFRANGKISM